MRIIIGTETMLVDELLALVIEHRSVYFVDWQDAEIYTGEDEALSSIEVQQAVVNRAEIESLSVKDRKWGFNLEYEPDACFYLHKEDAEAALKSVAAYYFESEKYGLIGYSVDKETLDRLFEAQRREEIESTVRSINKYGLKTFLAYMEDDPDCEPTGALCKDEPAVRTAFPNAKVIRECLPEEYADCGRKYISIG